MNIRYTRSHKRRPVMLGSDLGLTDPQGRIPRGWCPSCGSEVFPAGEVFCDRCAKEDQRNVRKMLRLPL